MIFVTVGSQMPFDRLVQTVDLWAGETHRLDVVGQIGRSTVKPRHFPWVVDMAPEEYRSHIDEAELVIAHAGMGTIISVMEAACRALLLPRRAALRETRNDHQVAAIPWLRRLPGIMVAETEAELAMLLHRRAWHVVGDDELLPSCTKASELLVRRLRQFIVGGDETLMEAKPGSAANARGSLCAD